MLSLKGINTIIHYPVPPHKQKAFSDIGLNNISLPITENMSKEIISLPIGPHLSIKNAESIVKSIKESFLL